MSYRESDRRRWQRERFSRRERAARARIKDLAAQLQQWLDEPEGDVIWEDLGDDQKRSAWAGRGRLYRDRDRGRLGGVCAGLAQYYRMRLWKVRAIALVALFIVPTVMVIAYLLALMFLPNAPAYQQSSYFERSARTSKKTGSPRYLRSKPRCLHRCSLVGESRGASASICETDKDQVSGFGIKAPRNGSVRYLAPLQDR